MKNIISLTSDLNSLGFDETFYTHCLGDTFNIKFINMLWVNLVKEMSLSSELLLKLKNCEEFKYNNTKDGITYKIYSKNISGHDAHKKICNLLGVITASTHPPIGFNICWNGQSISELTIGKPSGIKQGCYHEFKSSKDISYVFTYFNEVGEAVLTAKFRFNYRQYLCKHADDETEYYFVHENLFSFKNITKDVNIVFFQFTNMRKYRVRIVERGNIAVTFFYKGNIKTITRATATRKVVTTYYSTGHLKCKFSYDIDSGVMDGLYTQYDTSGVITSKTTWKQGDRHGVYEKYKKGVLVEKTHYSKDKKDGKSYKIIKGKITTSIYKDGKLIKRVK